MLRVQILGLALVSALMMSVVAAGSASAETELHQWLINHKLLASPVTVHLLGLLLLEDTATGVRVHCHGSATGTVGPHGLDLIKSITLELLGTKDLVLCLYDKVKALTCKENEMPDALAINLPWHTQLILHGTEVRDLILGHGGGKPGWKVTCKNVIGGTSTDTCEEEENKPGSTSMKNETNGSGVLGTFDGNNPRAKCSEAKGEPETGLVSGTVLTQSPSSKDHLLISFGP